MASIPLDCVNQNKPLLRQVALDSYFMRAMEKAAVVQGWGCSSGTELTVSTHMALRSIPCSPYSHPKEEITDQNKMSLSRQLSFT